jgi:hypothetical protein
MNFEIDRYDVIRGMISKEEANSLWEYAKNKMLDGTGKQDNQVPNSLSWYSDKTMNTMQEDDNMRKQSLIQAVSV